MNICVIIVAIIIIFEKGERLLKKTVWISGSVLVIVCLIFFYLKGINATKVKPVFNQHNIAYNSLSSSQKLDILYPKNMPEARPVVVFLHGGSYFYGDKSGYQKELGKLLNNNGYILVSLNYRLSGEMKYPGAVDDVKTAIRYLKKNAQELLIDPNRIYLMGHSAGANLGSMVISTAGTEALGNEPIKYPEYNSKVNGFIGASGFYNLNTFLAANDSRNSKFSQRKIASYYNIDLNKIKPSVLVKENNVNYIKNIKIPIYLLHGYQDRIVSYLETVDYCQNLKFRSDDMDVKCEISQNDKHGIKRFFKHPQDQKIISWLNNH